MNLNRIQQAEYAMRRIEARLSGLLEPELRAELADAAFLMAEIRHFAICVADAGVTPTQIEASTRRLVQACTPEN